MPSNLPRGCAPGLSWRPRLVIARNEAIHRRSHNDMDCHGAARLAMTEGMCAPRHDGIGRHCTLALSLRPRPVIARNEAIYWRLHNDMDCHGAARLAMTGEPCASRHDGIACHCTPPCHCTPGLSLRGTKQSKATAAPSVPCRSAAPGAMQLWIKRSIAARARLPQLKADAQRHGLPRRCAPRNDAVAGGRRNDAVESAARNDAGGACGGSSHAPGWGFSRA